MKIILIIFVFINRLEFAGSSWRNEKKRKRDGSIKEKGTVLKKKGRFYLISFFILFRLPRDARLD